jgi:PKD repeat protein
MCCFFLNIHGFFQTYLSKPDLIDSFEKKLLFIFFLLSAPLIKGNYDNAYLVVYQIPISCILTILNMKNSIYLLFTLFSTSVIAQHPKAPIESEAANKIVSSAKHSEIQTARLSSEVIPGKSSNWAVKMQFTSKEHSSPEVEAIQEKKLTAKLKYRHASSTPAFKTTVVTPVLGANFNGNTSGYLTPPDNSMAISNAGAIVSVNNDELRYYNTSGSSLFQSFWADFVNDATLTSFFFDPKVIYDSGADRFIMVLVHGNTPSTTKVIICFSKTNNPTGGWWIYKLTGNPLNNGTWLDYPNIGVSNNEVYVTGNLFTSGNSYDQAVVYQIGKTAGYAGGSLNWQYWYGFTSTPFTAISLMPATFGQQGNYGPGSYLVSTSSPGSDKIRLYHITNDIGSNPLLNEYSVNTTSYSVAAPAEQLGSPDYLDNGDCRIKNAFYLNGIIHFVFSSDAGQGYNGINYNRLTVSNLTNQSSLYGLNLSDDFCHPVVASFATTATDKSVMVAYMRSNYNIYPEIDVINCDHNMQWSSPVVVKTGDTYVDYPAATAFERWGDYIGISRRHNSTDARIWLAGSYGANYPASNIYNRYRTRIAEVHGATVGAAPVADFSATPVAGIVPLNSTFTDLSTNVPTTWAWSFPGGTPSSSTVQNPLVSYATPGYYSVTLTSSNTYGSNSITKTSYINATPNAIIDVDADNSTRVFPNPVNDLMNIIFNIPRDENVLVEILDAQGRRVKLLYQDAAPAGKSMLTFNKGALVAGTYFVRIKSETKLLKNEKIIIN